jgi:hypothetical protein
MHMYIIFATRLPHYKNIKDPTKAATSIPPPLDPKREPAPFPALTGAVVVAPGPVEMVVVAPEPLVFADDDAEVAEPEEEKTLM